MIDIAIAPEFLSAWPQTVLPCIEFNVSMRAHNPLLWAKIEQMSVELRKTIKIEEISQQTAIANSRKAYRALGKDPARYRLSAEALMRRVVKGNDLYQINNVVDIVNLVSATSGFSIGGYDADKIKGKAELGIGKAGEPYEAIGRGELNIENLPVLRDQCGAFGTPTSDSVRTSVTLDTKRFLMVFFGFGAQDELQEAVNLSKKLLEEFA